MKGKEPLPKASTHYADEEDLQPQADWNSGRPGSRLGEFLVASLILLILYDTDVPYLGDIEDGVEAREDFLCRRYEVAGSKMSAEPVQEPCSGVWWRFSPGRSVSPGAGQPNGESRY